MDETPVSPTKECVLKCNEPRQLFDFPSKHALRTLWLYKLGLDKYEEHLQVCDRHFSHTNQLEITIPDQNLPENIKRKESYEKLIERIMNSKILGRTDNIRLIENVSCVTIKEANPLPQRNDGLSGNERPSTEAQEKQPSNANITLSENGHDSTVIDKESQPPSVANTVAEKDSASTVLDEDLDPISVFMRIATDESASITIDVSSIPTSECREITDVSSNEIEDQSHTNEENESVLRLVEDIREENDFTSSIIEETLIEDRELTEKELSMIIEEDPQTEEALPATIESQPALPPADMPSTSSETLPPSKSNSAPKTKENLMNDTSTFLLDYQLCIQGKYMCDVIEIPEYVVVITIPKAKELRPTTLAKTNDLEHFKKKDNVRSLLDIPPSITISRTLSEEQIDGSESQQAEEIDYVYYMGEDENPRRDREVQVDIDIKTKDFANQCDVELDINMIPITQESKRNRPADFNKHECLVCGEILLNYLAQVKHYALHECELTSLCSYCGARFANPQKLIAHEKYFHVGIMMEIKEPLRCPRLYCQKAFHSKKQLYTHIDEHIGIVGHKCYICERVFTSAVQLFRHQKISNLCLRRKIWKQRQFFRRMLEG